MLALPLIAAGAAVVGLGFMAVAIWAPHALHFV
jgi:hypothetical protein